MVRFILLRTLVHVLDIGFWLILFITIMRYSINLIEDMYVDYISYKYFYNEIVLPNLGERKEWCKKTDWTVEWRGRQRLSNFRDLHGKFIYKNTKTDEKYFADMDDGHPED